MAFSLLISTPMFNGTSMPSSARTTVEKNVHWPHPVRDEPWMANELAVWCPPASQTKPAIPIMMRQKEYSRNWTFTEFCVSRKRSTPSRHENHSTASTMSPCCQGLENRLESIACESDTTRDPDRIMTRTPGHHAANPAKNPQNEPRALWVHTYREPSSGNI